MSSPEGGTVMGTDAPVSKSIDKWKIVNRGCAHARAGGSVAAQCGPLLVSYRELTEFRTVAVRSGTVLPVRQRRSDANTPSLAGMVETDGCYVFSGSGFTRTMRPFRECRHDRFGRRIGERSGGAEWSGPRDVLTYPERSPRLDFTWPALTGATDLPRGAADYDVLQRA
jgi:hypothetical protein